MSTETRWQQRYANYQKSLSFLDEAIKSYDEEDIVHRAGIIQFFEMTIELAWKTLQDLIEARGFEEKGPKPVIKKAFEIGLIPNGDAWIDMLDSRQLTTHTYDEETAEEISEKIKNKFYPLLDALDKKLAEEKKNEE